MNKVLCRSVVVAGLVLTLSGAVSWGGPPPNNVSSDPVLFNTAGGTGALGNNTTGKDNTAFGFDTLTTNTTGSLNTAYGLEALFSNTTGRNNTAGGVDALFSNTTGSNNTAYGLDTLSRNTTGYLNAAFGVNALSNNTLGYSNTASGVQALFQNTTGFYNAAHGFNTLNHNTTGAYNSALGVKALFSTTSGGKNTAFGAQALLATTGSGNTAIGYSAGSHLQSGDFNIYVGNTASVGTTAVTSESNTIRLGQVQTRTFIAGIRGVNVGSSGVNVVINSVGQLGTLVSSARYKRDIHDMGEGSQGLYSLRPVTFRYKQDTQGQRQYGLIAEEVAKVYPELVTKGADGKVESVQYHELIPMLLNEVQRQQQKLDAQAQELAKLKAQAQQVAELKARLERLEAGAARAAAVVTH